MMTWLPFAHLISYVAIQITTPKNISSASTVTKTLTQSVGQNRILAKKPRTDRQIDRTRCTLGNTGHKFSTALGTARLVRRSWKLRETSNKIPKQ